MHRLGILLSGRGSNFLAIAKAIGENRLLGAEIAIVLSNVEDAPGLDAAHELQASRLRHSLSRTQARRA